VASARTAGKSTYSDLEILDRELARFKAELENSTERSPQSVSSLLSYIHSNLFDPSLTVSAARESLGLKNNNVSARFRSCIGHGVKRYIEKLRIDASCRVLVVTEIRAYLVAVAVGYEHPETYWRAFHRRVGRTPTEYRQRYKQSNGVQPPRSPFVKKNYQEKP
jgi:transcriptional regulator GlxA family with amidase domain